MICPEADFRFCRWRNASLSTTTSVGTAHYHRLQAEKIPLEARIVSIVDAFDVIIHARPYKKASTIDIAMEAIQVEKGKQFDPHLTEAFFDLQPTVGVAVLSEALNREEASSIGVEACHYRNRSVSLEPGPA